MALPNGLEEVIYNAGGWTGIYNANFQKLDAYLLSRANATDALGETARADAAPLTAGTLTDSTTGTPGAAVGQVSGSGADAIINDNFASLTVQHNNVRADLVEIRSVLNDLLAKLRTTGGNGVLAD